MLGFKKLEDEQLEMHLSENIKLDTENRTYEFYYKSHFPKNHLQWDTKTFIVIEQIS